MNPQWQKAKIIKVLGVRCYGIGREIWVKGRPLEPDYSVRDGVDGSSQFSNELTFETNILHPDGQILAVRARTVELLYEFADDVPMVKWKDFVR